MLFVVHALDKKTFCRPAPSITAITASISTAPMSMWSTW
jgi:hypothetical protein